MIGTTDYFTPFVALHFGGMSRFRAWRGGRVVECGSLENCCTFGYREFESHPLRDHDLQDEKDEAG